jgi:hypothetical protein
MTTLRVEVGRHCGTTVEDVVRGLQQAGCMKDIEIVPNAGSEWIPIEELKRALEAELFHVELVPDPPPPALPWWRWPLTWPRRVYYWARRVVLRESFTEQLAHAFYRDTSAWEDIATRESPMLRKVRTDSEDEQ